MSEELDVVPSRSFWERTYPVSTLPKKITTLHNSLRNKFGREVADIVLTIYRLYGERLAVIVAKKMLEFNSTPELLSYLTKQVKRFKDPDRSKLIAMIYRYQYGYYFQEVLDLSSKSSCERAQDLATRIYHILASRGLFFKPECIVLLAEKIICGGSLPHYCSRVEKEYEELVNGG